MTTATSEKIKLPTGTDALPGHPNVGYRRFIAAIGKGTLEPGSVVSQQQLCDLLDISLTPLRETLVLLEEFGLVNVKPRSGIQIVNPELEFVRDNYQFRIMIEKEALPAFIAACSPPWLETVRAAHAEILGLLNSRAADAATLDRFVALDHFLHFSIVETLGNRSILTTHNRLQENIRLVRSLHRGRNLSFDQFRTAAQEHLDLLDRIEARDEAGAALCLERHFQSSTYRTLMAS